MTERRTLVPFLLLSVAIHALAIASLSAPPHAPRPLARAIPIALAAPTPSIGTVDVPSPRTQIVVPPDATFPPDDASPPDTRLHSDRDASTPSEMVKRGEAGRTPAAPGSGPSEIRAAAHAPAPGRERTAPSRDDAVTPRTPEPSLFAAQTELQRQLADLPLDGDAGGSFETPPPDLLASLAAGTPDYLPDVPAGRITLLNTKADRFAPFVRRVAMRVFQHLLILERRSLERFAGRVEAVARVTLTPRGELASVAVDGSTGALGPLLHEACTAAAWDRNPPRGAAGADGTIRFVFEAQVELLYGAGPTPWAARSFLGVGLL
jgi:hypothetical protein